MNIFTWSQEKIKKLNWIDMALIKIAVASATLMLAKLWEPLLYLDWYWYALIYILVVARPFSKIFSNK